MRKKKSPQIVKVEKINELHTNTNITNESILNKESLLNKNNVSNKEETAFKPLLLTTTKGQLDTIIEEKNNKKKQENIFNINNIETKKSKQSKNSNKNSKKSKKSKKNNNIIKLKNNILINKYYKYENLLNYIKSNKIKITNFLYEKKILKCKKIPLLLLLNLYTNYINNDITII